jgi:hypothetical protein
MEIITKLPRYSDGEIDRAFMREIQRGFEIEKRTESQRVDQARKEAKQEQGKTHPVLGKCVATMPAREFFRLTKKYGHKEIHSKKFLQYYNKKFTDLSHVTLLVQRQGILMLIHYPVLLLVQAQQ